MDVTAWLRDLGLEQYAAAFAANDIDGDTLPLLSGDDLRELGVASLGHRKKLLAAIGALRAPAAPSGERRQVTILFADLSGFTALSRTLDAEELHAIVARYTATVDAVVERHGGTVDKHIGDAVMALFGAPVAHTDDPRRAALAGLEIHAAMERLSGQLCRTLRSHVGMASGQVVAGGLARSGTHDYTVLGDAVNLASRLEGLAKAGETLVSDDAWRAIGPGVEGDDLGEHAIKGLDAPVRVWRLQAVRSEAPRGALVGRGAEIAAFVATLDDAERGLGGTIVLRGEPGIGKTRLLEELVAVGGGRGFAVHRAFVLDFGAEQAQHALATLARSLLRDRDVDAAACPEHAPLLRDLLGIPQPDGDRGWVDAMSPAMREERRAEALAALAAASEQLLLCVEDVHWADAATLDTLRRIGAAVVERGSVLVLTTRVHGDPLDDGWRAGAGRVRALDLGPLAEHDARALASAFAAEDEVVARCIERAGGHPLFLEQLLRHARDLADGIPGTIHSLVLARVDRLGPRDRAIVQTASVLGQLVERSALAWLLGAEDAGVDELIEAGLLRDEGAALRFTHALVQEGVYASLLRARRRELHVRAAEWYAGRDVVLRARHLDRAEHPDAPAAYVAAAAARHAVMDLVEARRLAERGLELATARVDRFALACRRGEILTDAGAVGEAEACWRVALEDAEGADDRCRAWIGLASVLRLGDRHAEAFDALDRAEAAAPADLGRERARIHYHRGNLCFAAGRIARCREEHERALALAGSCDDVGTAAGAWSGLADVAYALGHMQTARQGFQRAQALGEEHCRLRIAVAAAGMVLAASLYLAPAAELLPDTARLHETATRLGDARIAVLADQLVSLPLYHLGDADAMLFHVRRSAGGARAIRSLRFIAQALEFEARARLLQGQREEAARLARESLRLVDEIGPAFAGARTLSVLARATDDATERSAALERGEAWLRQGSLSHSHLWYRFDAIELALGDPAALRHHADALEAHVAEEPFPWATLVIDRARAVARFREGVRDEALRRDLAAIDARAEALGMQIVRPALREALAAL